MNSDRNYISRLFKLVFVFAISGYASASAAVTLISDDRAVDYFGSQITLQTLTPPTPFQNWSVDGQVSQVGVDRFAGVGTGVGESDTDFFIRESVFDITFALDASTLMELSGATSGEDGDFGLGSASVTLYGGAGLQDVLFTSSSGSGLFLTFAFDEVLAPGMYRLFLTTNITPGGFGTLAEWSFSADFTEMAVPIPAMGWLFGLVVLGLYRRANS